jgi:hypothetical protein
MPQAPSVRRIPDCPLVEKRGSRLPEAFAIALEDCVGGVVASDLHLRGEFDACREANEIEGIRHNSRLIEIVHAPYPSPVGIVPRPEILQMDVADAKGGGRVDQLRADLLDAPCPAIIGRAQEHERVLAHPLVLAGEVFLDHLALGAKPAFVGRGIFENGHADASRLRVGQEVAHGGRTFALQLALLPGVGQ